MPSPVESLVTSAESGKIQPRTGDEEQLLHLQPEPNTGKVSFDKFDGIPNGFYIHKHEEHNPWHYMFFLYNVRFKRPSKLRGLEIFVYQQELIHDSSWVPIHRAGRLGDTEEEITDQKLQEIENTLAQLKANLLRSV
jgi:hypothetical protein